MIRYSTPGGTEQGLGMSDDDLSPDQVEAITAYVDIEAPPPVASSKAARSASC